MPSCCVRRGAEVAEFDPLTDPLPDGTDALLLPGGFPEQFTAELSANDLVREQIKALAAAGAPVHAECAGLTYLVSELDGHPMCGVLSGSAWFTERLTLAYRDAVAVAESSLYRAGQRVVGHEFHRTTVAFTRDLPAGVGIPGPRRLSSIRDGAVVGRRARVVLAHPPRCPAAGGCRSFVAHAKTPRLGRVTENAYLVGLRLGGKKVVVVGGGSVAQRRLPLLIASGADVHVITRAATPAVEALDGQRNLLGTARLSRRRPRRRLVRDRRHRRPDRSTPTIVAEADRRRIFCVRADIARDGTAVTPASFEYDGLSVGVLAGGEHRRSAAIRSAIREALQQGIITAESTGRGARRGRAGRRRARRSRN